MQTSEVLNRAADHIEERGWGHGEGWIGTAPGPLCIEGAIAAAMDERGGPGYRCPASDAVRDYLGTTKGLWAWNDSLLFVAGQWKLGFVVDEDLEASEAIAKRTVIATLRAAAVIEAAKENAPEVAPLPVKAVAQ